ncbi:MULTISPECIES: hypothetical protein [Herbaspirillum]|uniref:Uncharacterized protein n=1 Tax=Herbaspirillum frisingense TaxID=92645 RepID=A0ABU1PD81_9BURK|nr:MULTISPECIES: hypothetical protein [Herbaspirillum]MDR6583882.1 hypothetical protein [Herbaspirillum frisingense]
MGCEHFASEAALPRWLPEGPGEAICRRREDINNDDNGAKPCPKMDLDARRRGKKKKRLVSVATRQSPLFRTAAFVSANTASGWRQPGQEGCLLDRNQVARDHGADEQGVREDVGDDVHGELREEKLICCIAIYSLHRDASTFESQYQLSLL